MEYLFSVFWRNIKIGYCFTYNNQYVFMYDKQGIEKTSEFGFNKLIGFPDINEIYINNQLFPIFDSRIISSTRVKHLDRKQKINYLIQTKGQLITDNITIEKEELENVKRFF